MLITPHLPNIVRLISSDDTVSIVAATGSGKSVAVPAAIAAAGARCFVTVPTRTAAVSLAEFQRVLQSAAAPDINVKELVGYAAEGNVNYGPNTRIAYVTGGHARRKMLSYFSEGVAKPIDFCDVLMVDEVHSGSLDTTIIISLWMYAALSGVLVPRLVVASATPVPLEIIPEPQVYTVELAAHPIEFRYLDKDIDLDDPSGLLYTFAAEIAADIHIKSSIDSGHILVFAPGSNEVELVAATLKQLLEKPVSGKRVDIIPAFGALKPEDIGLIYKETGPDERKIVIATNIAEMSITISDVGHVIDTLVEKRAETSQNGGFRLTTRYISKDSAKQRAGRTGRTRAGVCYRMCTQILFDSLEEHRPPEIQRIPIYETVMELLDVGLSPEKVIKGIDTQRVLQATQLLAKIGMVVSGAGTRLSPTVTSGLIVTDMGHFAPKFHISVRNAAYLWNWIQSGYPVFPGIVSAALIDSYGPSYYWIPRRKQDMSMDEYNYMVRQYKEKYFSKYAGYNDLETSLNMWNDLMEYTGDINASQRVVANWSRNNSINNKKIKELLTIIQQCVNSAYRLGYNVQIGPFTTAGVMKAARPILLSVYSDMILRFYKDNTYLSITTNQDYRLDNRDAVNNFSDDPPNGIIALSTAEIKTQRGAFRVVSFGVDTDTDDQGRPLKQKPVSEHRGPRTIIHRRTQPAPETQPEPDVTQALALLAGLNVGTTQSEPNVNEALALLSGLNIGTIEQPQKLDPTFEAFDLLATLQNIPLPDIPAPIVVPFPEPIAKDIIEISGIAGASDSQLDEVVRIAALNLDKDSRFVNSKEIIAKLGYIDIYRPKYKQIKPYWMILKNGQVIGYVGIHDHIVDRFGDYGLIAFIDPAVTNQEILIQAINMAVKNFKILIMGNVERKTLVIKVDENDKQRISTVLSSGFILKDTGVSGAKRYNFYQLPSLNDEQNISLFPIDRADRTDLIALSEIGTLPEIYNNIGRKMPWDYDHVRDLRDRAIEDKRNNYTKYLHWLILLNDLVVGYIGIHPTPSEREYPGSQVRYFVSPYHSGKGIATEALKQLPSKLPRNYDLWSFILPTNVASIRVTEKAGFKFVKSDLINNVPINVYYRNPTDRRR